MWKAIWKKWTIDKPAAFGDLLWEVFVVQFATYLNTLTLRRVIALIPIVILILAYDHKIPIPPSLMLVGDSGLYRHLHGDIPDRHFDPGHDHAVCGEAGDGACCQAAGQPAAKNPAAGFPEPA